jgi:hypothetical protein
MAFKRQKIGSINRQSPAMKFNCWFSNIFSRICFCIIALIAIYYFFMYFVINFVNFMITNISLGNTITKDNKIFVIFMIFFMLVTAFSILKDRLTKR